MGPLDCPFCRVAQDRIFHEGPLTLGLWDAFPVSPAHALLVPRRHVATWFEATPAEQTELTAAIAIARDAILSRLRPQVPDGFNIGINVGAAGGQTVFHLHVHVIPRFHGDVPDPRGGVRHVIPARANYLRHDASGSPPRALATGGSDDPFLRHLRPLFARANDVAIIAAFVQDSGLTRLQHLMSDALRRGARIRIVTGDYLDITQASALHRLLDWQSASEAFEPSGDDAAEGMDATASTATNELAAAPRGRLEARIVEVGDDHESVVSFHPKSWRFEGDGLATAFVGSSNVSATALGAGIEWNLRVDRERDPAAYAEVVDAFEHWWSRARPLTADWVEAYAERVRRTPRALPPGEVEAEAPPRKPEPHEIQQAALDALAATRADRRKRGLVVMATGLGKTLLAAFDVDAVRASLGRMPRVLFIAHRSELLEQAAAAFRRVFPDARFGWFAADRADTDGDVIFASVAKLSQPARLERLIRDAGRSPDYVIVDEVHHATAPSYRRILDRLDPGFVLGLTATPDRLDEADVLGLLDDNLVYRADLGVGIAHGRLSPFAYFGLADVVNYANIPWRNRRFDPAVLAQAVQTQARMERLWRAWNEHAARRSLVFCCSIAHARFVRDWLRERGVRAVAVYAAPESDDREDALEKLATGELDAVCSVDLFNEGVDVSAVDRVVMLRPTESPVVFLQQLGRGLRRADGKDQLVVIDFVGNHRVFLDRVCTLISLGGRTVSVRDFIERGMQPELPEGCSIDVELEAIDMLRRFLPAGASEVERVYRELRASRDERPTAAELARLGYRPGTLRPTHGGWFDFVAREGDLDDAETRVLAAAGDWLRELETTAMTKCFKMVVLEVLLERDALTSGMPLDELARLSHAYLLRFPELMRDIEGVKELDDPRRPDPARWLAYWRKNPIAAWSGSRWFSVDGERLVPHLTSSPGDEPTLAAMTREIVESRLVDYVARARAAAAGDALECVVTWKQRDPILKLPSRAARPDLPSGETDVRLPDGSAWRFRFLKDSCSVARPLGTATNQLPDLLRRWFGPDAGRPGTELHVRFTRSPDGWWIEPASARVVPLAPRGSVVTFPSLRAAAGHARASALAERVADAPGPETVRLPVSGSPSPELFAVRAVGDSMDGGDAPIHDGDWVVLRWARAARVGALEGRVALVELPASPHDASPDSAYVLKCVQRDGDRWLLVSDSPGGPTIPASADTKVIAIVERVIRPETSHPPSANASPTSIFPARSVWSRAFKKSAARAPISASKGTCSCASSSAVRWSSRIASVRRCPTDGPARRRSSCRGRRVRSRGATRAWRARSTVISGPFPPSTSRRGARLARAATSLGGCPRATSTARAKSCEPCCATPASAACCRATASSYGSSARRHAADCGLPAQPTRPAETRASPSARCRCSTSPGCSSLPTTSGPKAACSTRRASTGCAIWTERRRARPAGSTRGGRCSSSASANRRACGTRGVARPRPRAATEHRPAAHRLGALPRRLLPVLLRLLQRGAQQVAHRVGATDLEKRRLLLQAQRVPVDLLDQRCWQADRHCHPRVRLLRSRHTLTPRPFSYTKTCVRLR